jgi:hypothetical protein
MEASRTNGISICALRAGRTVLGQSEAGDGAARVGDDDGLAALHIVEQPGQMGLGPDARTSRMTFHFDWSN